MKTDGIDCRKEFASFTERDAANTPPSERKAASELYDALFEADYVYWRQFDYTHREAIDRATMSQKNREKEARKDAAQKAAEKPVARQAALPCLQVVTELDEDRETERRKEWAEASPEKWKELYPSLTADQIIDGMIGREHEFIEVWNRVAKKISNPFVALRVFLYAQDVRHERDRLFAREKRVELEARVSALEEKGSGLRYLGVFNDGSVYSPGDIVTFGGSAWYCHLSTCGTRPGTTKHFQLMVKKGRDSSRPPRDGGGGE